MMVRMWTKTESATPITFLVVKGIINYLEATDIAGNTARNPTTGSSILIVSLPPPTLRRLASVIIVVIIIAALSILTRDIAK